MKRAYLTTRYSYIDRDGLRSFDGEYCYAYNPDSETMNEAMDNRGKAVFGFQAREGHESCNTWRIVREVWGDDVFNETVVVMDSAEHNDGEIMRALMAWAKNPTARNELVLDAIFEDANIAEWRSDYFKGRAMRANNRRKNNG